MGKGGREGGREGETTQGSMEVWQLQACNAKRTTARESNTLMALVRCEARDCTRILLDQVWVLLPLTGLVLYSCPVAAALARAHGVFWLTSASLFFSCVSIQLGILERDPRNARHLKPAATRRARGRQPIIAGVRVDGRSHALPQGLPPPVARAPRTGGRRVVVVPRVRCLRE